jgi:hypothetical protein
MVETELCKSDALEGSPTPRQGLSSIRRPSMLPQDILQALYESEINCRIESFWDGGWVGLLDNELNGFRVAKVRGATFAECVNNLAGQACLVYPMSNFASAYRGKFWGTLVATPRCPSGSSSGEPPCPLPLSRLSFSSSEDSIGA